MVLLPLAVAAPELFWPHTRTRTPNPYPEPVPNSPEPRTEPRTELRPVRRPVRRSRTPPRTTGRPPLLALRMGGMQRYGPTERAVTLWGHEIACLWPFGDMKMLTLFANVLCALALLKNQMYH